MTSINDIFSGLKLGIGLRGSMYCCGLTEIGNVPTTGVGAQRFLEACTKWAEQYKPGSGKLPAERHISVYFTHQTETELYKLAKKTSGVKVVHEWTNSNSRRRLFMAIVSPEYLYVPEPEIEVEEEEEEDLADIVRKQPVKRSTKSRKPAVKTAVKRTVRRTVKR